MAGNRDNYEQAMRAAFDHSWNRDWKAAIEAYKHALMEFPQDLPATVGLGGVFVELKQPQVALKVFERAVQLAPEDTDALHHLADVQERLGRLEDAAATHARVGQVFARQGKLEEAADAWTQSSRLASNQVQVYLRLAGVLEELGRSEQAAAEYAIVASVVHRQGNKDLAFEYCQEALRLDPGNSKAQAMIKSLQGDRRQPAAAGLGFWDEPVSTPVREKPTGEDIFSLESLAEEEADGRTPAERAQRRALQELADMLFEVGEEDGPDLTTVAVIGQGIDQQTRGLLDDAIHSYLKALKSGLTRMAISFNLGMIYYERMRYDEAIEAFRRSMRDEDYALGSHYALGLTYQKAGKTDRCLEHFVEVVKAVDLETIQPEQAQKLNAIYQQLSDSYIAKGNTEPANIFIRTVMEFFSKLNWQQKAYEARRLMDSLSGGSELMALGEYLETPETEVIVTAMALTGEYMRRNMLRTAAEECFRAIQKVPSYLPLHVRLADIFLQQEHTPEAITKYLAVAEVYQMRGEPEQTIDIYQKVLQLAQMDVKVRTKLIDLLIMRGEADQALEQYLVLADVHYQLAQVDQALEKYLEALRLAPSSTKENSWKVGILHRMGDIYNQRVDWAQAAAAYESIVSVAPHDERAQLALVDLYFKQGQSSKALQALDTLLGIYRKAGKERKILDSLREIVQTRPEEMGLRARLAATYAQQGMAKQAIAEYDALGEMQLEAGLREEAAQTIQTIINLGPDDIEGYRRLFSQIKGGSL